MALCLLGGGTSARAEDVTVGEKDNSTAWWSAFSEYYTLAPNKTLTLNFTNYSDKVENFHNWLAVVTTDADRGATGYSEYLVLRADNHGWGGLYASGTLTSNYNWGTFKDDMDGSNVVLTVERRGAQVTVNADITASDGETKYFENFVFNCGLGTQTIRAFMTTEKGHLAIHSATISDTEGALFATTKMTYVDKNNADVPYGEITAGNSARSGYNKISGGSVAFANEGWGANYITYLKVDASSLPAEATITSASLSFEQSGSTDGKRTTGVGAGYNSSAWASDMTYNTADKSITTVGDVVWTTTKSSSEFETKTINITPALANDDDKIVTILLYETAAAGCYIKNPIVNINYTTAASANYTIKYVAEISGVETEIQASRSEIGVVGETGSLVETDKNVIWYGGAKYVYSTDNASSTTIASDNSSVVTVTFVEAPSYSYNIVDNLGNTLANGSAYEGENVNFYVPYYAFKDGKFYASPSLSSGALSYGQGTISSIAANTDITVTYTEEANSNVVFFSEAENLTGITAHNDGFTNIRMSNGKAGYYAAQTAFISLPAGTYTLTAATRAGETKFYAGAVGEGVEVMTLSSTGSVVTTTSAPFTLTTTTDIYTSTGSTKAYFDYVIIRQTGVVATIATSGYSTLASSYALDCANLPSGLKAYKVTGVTKTAVNLEEVSEAVQAGTGLILEGAPSETYSIPVAVSGSDISSTNKLKAAVTATDVAANEAYILQGGKFHLVTGASTVPAGKAYLLATDVPANVRALDMVVDGGADGISAIDNAQSTGNAMFDLSGRRVDKAKKGIYIVNGKKVVK